MMSNPIVTAPNCVIRAGPRPLPDRFQARLIDIHDNDRPDLLRPRPKHLKEIEGAGAELLERPRIGKAQWNKRD